MLFERDLSVVLIRRYEEHGHVDVTQAVRDAPLHDGVRRPEIGLFVVPRPPADERAPGVFLGRFDKEPLGDAFSDGPHAEHLHRQSAGSMRDATHRNDATRYDKFPGVPAYGSTDQALR